MTYTKCVKSFSKGKILEKKSQITVKEYYSIKELETPGKNIVRKVRNSFMYKDNNFILDTFNVGEVRVSVLIIQGHKDKKAVAMPDIITKNVVAEIACRFIR